MGVRSVMVLFVLNVIGEGDERGDEVFFVGYGARSVSRGWGKCGLQPGMIVTDHMGVFDGGQHADFLDHSCELFAAAFDIRRVE